MMADRRQWDTLHYSKEAKQVFDRIDGKIAQTSTKRIRSEFQRACAAVGVRIGKPYELRSLFGTEARKTYSIEVVRDLLRHKDIQTTAGSYAKVRRPEQEEAAEAMQKKIAAVLE